MSLPADILRAIEGRRALVTGGTGMIGREVVRLLLEGGAEVTSVSLDRLQPVHGARYVHGDLSDLGLCLDLTADMDLVLHVAGIKGSVKVTQSRPASFFVPLLMMNTNMLEAARRNNVDHVVYTSSIGAYSPGEVFREAEHDPALPPMDMFPGWAKRMAEMQVEAYRIQYGLRNFAVVRPSNVYGPGDNFDPDNAMVIPTLMAKVARGDDPVEIWGDGSAVRDFVFAEDAARGIILACVRGTGDGFINIGGPRGVTIRELVETLQRVTPFNARFDPSKPGGFPRRVMELDHARATVGYDPAVSLEEGLSRTWAWYRTNRAEHLSKQNYFAEA
ncbi:MAG: NAD(P)-dependent oxidoreductase [Alphaproteobacteria bacterium]